MRSGWAVDSRLCSRGALSPGTYRRKSLWSTIATGDSVKVHVGPTYGVIVLSALVFVGFGAGIFISASSVPDRAGGLFVIAAGVVVGVVDVWRFLLIATAEAIYFGTAGLWRSRRTCMLFSDLTVTSVTPNSRGLGYRLLLVANERGVEADALFLTRSSAERWHRALEQRLRD